MEQKKRKLRLLYIMKSVLWILMFNRQIFIMTNMAETLWNYFAREWMQQDKLKLSVT